MARNDYHDVIVHGDVTAAFMQSAGGFFANAQKITGVADGSDDLGAVNKGQLDTKADVGHQHPAPTNYTDMWLWNEATAGDPGSGRMLSDTTTFDTTTNLAISKTDGAGNQTQFWWTAIIAGDEIIVVDSERAGLLQATVTGPAADRGAYIDVPVAAGGNSTATNPRAGDETIVIWLPGGSTDEVVVSAVEPTSMSVELWVDLGA